MELKRYAAKTHQGPFIQNNEDGYNVELSSQLYMLFDGFGGAGIGDQVVKNLIQNISNFYLKIADDPEATVPFAHNEKYSIEANALINACLASQQLLWRENQQLDINRRGGASGQILNQVGSTLYVFSVGNLLLLRKRGHHFSSIIQPDSFHTLSHSAKGPYVTFPLSAFGLYEHLDFRFYEFRTYPLDTYLCLTDGIYNYLSPRELCEFFRPEEPLNQSLELMFQRACQRGNKDNLSALILEY